MELSIDAAKSALAHPSAELQAALTDERVPASTREALGASMREASAAAAASTDGPKAGKPAPAVNGASGSGSSKPGDGRLQVVDEKQTFSCVPLDVVGTRVCG